LSRNVAVLGKGLSVSYQRAGEVDTDTRDLLPNIAVPTLLIGGEADARSPIAVGHQFHDAIHGSELAVIPGAGHISKMEQPGRFDAEVRSFCLGPAIA